MADSKKSRGRQEQKAVESDAASLSESEVEVSLICLRYFRGDWDMYLDYLQGTRVTADQRRRDLPLVEALRDRDRRTEFLTAFLEDEVMTIAQRLSFDGLLKLWEHGLELDPESEPFPEFRGENDSLDAAEPGHDRPPTLH
ncbi:MAG: hypothetical protein PHQ53_07930 [Candidatus Krumholzibacteria bacterium]|nr:hypothetical protein [Candidatus Krumholzibacteria bacterium]